MKPTIGENAPVTETDRLMHIQLNLSQLCTTFLLILLFSGRTVSAGADFTDPLPRDPDKPLEQVDGINTIYGSVEVEPGVRLRTLISVPKNTDKALPPLLFTQWVSCGSVELDAGSGGMLGMLARSSNLALVRVDRAGSGDSQGPACNELDYQTEVAHYITAFEQLLESDHIDASNVYVFGQSLGSTTAPLVAMALQEMGYNISAVIVQGGGALTYLERMINFDRLYLERRPNDVPRGDIHEQMNQRIIFQVEYLAKRRHPDEIAKDSPEMATVRNDILGMSELDHYGRPFSWHQQAAEQNFLAAWDALNTKVLVIFNEFDQYESLHGHQLIVDTVNLNAPGQATLLVQNDLGHSSWRYSSAQAAYADEGGERRVDLTAQEILNWLDENRD